MKQSKGIESRITTSSKPLKTQSGGQNHGSIRAVLAILGLGITFPMKSVASSSVRFLGLGTVHLQQGRGIESTVNRVIQEMRENADAAMFSSLLWTLRCSVPSSLWLRDAGVCLRSHRKFPIGVVVKRDSLFAGVDGYRVPHLNGWLHALAPKRGSFSGSLIVLSVFGMVVYSFLNSALDIAIRVLSGTSYEFSVEMILNDLTTPLIWVVVLWMVTTVVRTLQTRQAQADRYWGI